MNENRKSIGGARGVTRLFAVQVLYCADILKKSAVDILSDECRQHQVMLAEDIPLDDVNDQFLCDLVGKYSEHAEFIDIIIISHLSNKWTADRLNKVVVAILRLGVTELLYFSDIPANVTFNEYIEIGKAFFPKRDVSFINGLLNSVHQENIRQKA